MRPQVDVALLIDLSGSMSNWLDDVQRLLSDALPRIPSTTAIQVWVIPPDGADGTYGSMSNWLDDVQRLLSDALPRIPSTTAIQVWVIPPDGADGTYARVTGLVTPREALAVVQDLMTNSSGREASLDVTDALIRSRSDWRYGTTVRAFVMISDEMPQSHVVTPPLTVAQVCALAEPNDRLVVYTLNSERVYWDASCWDVRSLWELDSLPDLVIDPCLEV